MNLLSNKTNDEFEKINRLQAEFNKKLKTNGRDSVISSIQEFIRSSDLVAIMWRQYIPYFNDGDACHFDLYEVYGTYKELDDDYYNYNWVEVWSDEKEQIKEIQLSLEKIKDCLETMFGSHVEVIVTADNFEINDYSQHD